MKVIVIGLGSMGKRRIRLLSEHKDIEIFGIDSNEDRCKEVEDKYGVNCFISIAKAKAEQPIGCAFVCTSPLSHAGIITECLNQGLHVFTEINLVSDGYDENMKLAKEKGLVLFLSSTFLYRKETQAIIEKVKSENSKVNYIYHVGQYLPDWHPWESYNNYFIGNSRTNGCRELMAIEFPWIVAAFGSVKSTQVLKSKNTSLNISYNDNYLIMLEHESGAKGMIAVDVIARKAIRHMDVFGENLQLTWNGTPDSLVEFDINNKQEHYVKFDDAVEHVTGYASFITENPYREEINAFLSQVNDPSIIPAWDFNRDMDVLKVIDQIEA